MQEHGADRCRQSRREISGATQAGGDDDVDGGALSPDSGKTVMHGGLADHIVGSREPAEVVDQNQHR